MSLDRFLLEWFYALACDAEIEAYHAEKFRTWDRLVSIRQRLGFAVRWAS